MWSSVVTGAGGGDTPGARHKHAVCTSYPFVYLLGGRQGNLPLKDFWIYDLGTRTWRQECEDKGSRPPSLQQHSMVWSQGKIFVFGGELCMSNETPLWIYEIQRRQWRKWQHSISDEGGGGQRKSGGLKRESGSASPDGRRGHSAIVVEGQMIVYGGYRDLRGSTGEIWSFNIKEETWRQIPTRGDQPPARHSHTAVVHDNQMWVYGGMTDLIERNDFWKYDITLRMWTHLRLRPSPGLLHSHVAVKLHSSMIVFGGQRQGEVLNDLWRYHFATGLWEKLMPSGVKPQPRSQACAFVGPSHASKHFRFSSGYSSLGGASSSSGSSSSSSGYGSARSGEMSRARRNNQLDFAGGRGFSESTTLSHGTGDSVIMEKSFSQSRVIDDPQRICGYGPSHIDDPNRICGCRECTDPSDDDEIDPHRLRSLIQRNCANPQNPNLKLSISKISQLNLSHLGRYYSYSVLSNDSSESIVDESLASTCDSVVSRLVKSQSSHGLTDDENYRMSLPRDIVSVPNFAEICEKGDDKCINTNVPMENLKTITVLPAEGSTEDCLEDDPSELIAGIKGKLEFCGYENAISTDTSISENLISFCTESTVSSVSNYNLGGSSSFSNPNYVGFDPDKTGGFLSQDYWRKGALDLESVRHKEFAELLRTPPDSGIGLGVEMERRPPLDVSMAALEDFVTFDSKVARFMKPKDSDMYINKANLSVISHGPGVDDSKNDKKPGPTHGANRVTFCTDPTQITEGSSCANSGGNTNPNDKNPMRGRINPFLKKELPPEPEGPDAMYIIGGKEIGQLAVFKRPISIWKLDLPY